MEYPNRKNSFNFFEEPNIGNFLCLEFERLKECISFIEENNINNILIDDVRMFNSDQVKFLLKLSEKLERLIIWAGEFDLSYIHHLRELKFIMIYDYEGQNLDLSFFPKLEELRITWHSKIEGLSKCPNLKKLRLNGINAQNFKFKDLAVLKSLEELVVMNSNFTQLLEIKNLKKLKELRFINCLQLNDLDYIECLTDSLLVLELDNCPNVSIYEVLFNLPLLTTLILNRCHDLPSIDFVNQLKFLKRFTFVETRILDGNLNYFLGKKLEFVGFSNSSQNSHSLYEIRKAIGM